MGEHGLWEGLGFVLMTEVERGTIPAPGSRTGILAKFSQGPGYCLAPSGPTNHPCSFRSGTSWPPHLHLQTHPSSPSPVQPLVTGPSWPPKCSASGVCSSCS